MLNCNHKYDENVKCMVAANGVRLQTKRIAFFGDNFHKKLTLKEAQLLQLLYNNLNQTVKRERILEEIWGKNDYFIGRSMDVFISRLRKYLSMDANIEINNYHGIGFKLSIHSPNN